ncbi:hypothetical protein DL96DRAFT_1821147, partial [Flagelloscypha sp. PMI_526]
MTLKAPGEMTLTSGAEVASLTNSPWGYLGGLVLVALLAYAYRWINSLPKRTEEAIVILEEFFVRNFTRLDDPYTFLDRFKELKAEYDKLKKRSDLIQCGQYTYWERVHYVWCAIDWLRRITEFHNSEKALQLQRQRISGV